jgi:hypothetical protein
LKQPVDVDVDALVKQVEELRARHPAIASLPVEAVQRYCFSFVTNGIKHKKWVTPVLSTPELLKKQVFVAGKKDSIIGRIVDTTADGYVVRVRPMDAVDDPSRDKLVVLIRPWMMESDDVSAPFGACWFCQTLGETNANANVFGDPDVKLCGDGITDRCIKDRCSPSVQDLGALQTAICQFVSATRTGISCAPFEPHVDLFAEPSATEEPSAPPATEPSAAEPPATFQALIDGIDRFKTARSIKDKRDIDCAAIEAQIRPYVPADTAIKFGCPGLFSICHEEHYNGAKDTIKLGLELNYTPITAEFAIHDTPAVLVDSISPDGRFLIVHEPFLSPFALVAVDFPASGAKLYAPPLIPAEAAAIFEDRLKQHSTLDFATVTAFLQKLVELKDGSSTEYVLDFKEEHALDSLLRGETASTAEKQQQQLAKDAVMRDETPKAPSCSDATASAFPESFASMKDALTDEEFAQWLNLMRKASAKGVNLFTPAPAAAAAASAAAASPAKVVDGDDEDYDEAMSDEVLVVSSTGKGKAKAKVKVEAAVRQERRTGFGDQVNSEANKAHFEQVYKTSKLGDVLKAQQLLHPSAWPYLRAVDNFENQGGLVALATHLPEGFQVAQEFYEPMELCTALQRKAENCYTVSVVDSAGANEFRLYPVTVSAKEELEAERARKKHRSNGGKAAAAEDSIKPIDRVCYTGLKPEWLKHWYYKDNTAGRHWIFDLDASVPSMLLRSYQQQAQVMSSTVPPKPVVNPNMEHLGAVVVAARNFLQGEVVAEVTGEFLKFEEMGMVAKRIVESGEQDPFKYFYPLGPTKADIRHGYKERWVLCNYWRGNESRWIHQYHNPNVMAVSVARDEERRFRVVLVATRDIKAGRLLMINHAQRLPEAYINKIASECSVNPLGIKCQCESSQCGNYSHLVYGKSKAETMTPEERAQAERDRLAREDERKKLEREKRKEAALLKKEQGRGQKRKKSAAAAAEEDEDTVDE